MAMVDLFDRITVEPEKWGGKPCIRGMRITVRRVPELPNRKKELGKGLLAKMCRDLKIRAEEL